MRFSIALLQCLLIQQQANMATAFQASFPSSLARIPAGSSSSSSTTSTTQLFISSWSSSSAKFKREQETRINPMERIQDYIKQPVSVEARATIDGTVLVSGVANGDRTDQFLFDLLNHQESAFEFKQIIAFVADMAVSKKRLLSRSARYTGLLDKLSFRQEENGNKLPSVEQLAGVKSWLAVIDATAAASTNAVDECHAIAQLAAAAGPDLTNVAILLTGANNIDMTACQKVVDSFVSSGKCYTIVAVGTLTEEAEGKHPYRHEPFGTVEAVLAANATYSRTEAFRTITELLQLESGVNTAFTFTEVYESNSTEARLIKGLRSAGYDRMQEMDHMIRLGGKGYDTFITEFKEKNPDWDKAGVYTTNAWWEAPEYKKSRERSDAKAAAALAHIKDEKTLAIETLAKEWGKREFFRLSMEGMMTLGGDMDEEAFLQKNWDRAVKEGEWAYRRSNGDLTEEEAANEMEDFKILQDKKQQAMLKRAKEELKDIIDG
jgi:hypothetical protein